MATGAKVAVVGLGAFGLVTLKNLLEEGYDAVGLERSGRVGGLWTFEPGSKTTVLESTTANVSKQRFCYTDFPYPDAIDTYPTATQVSQYLHDYVERFSLGSHIRLNSEVRQVSRNDERGRWEVGVVDQRGQVAVEHFDKLVFTTGINNLPRIPVFDGVEKFQGTIIHSNTFKMPKEFKDKRVVVVGLSNTAGDTAMSLIGYASKIYLSHRGGVMMLRRWIEGKPLDHTMTYQKIYMAQMQKQCFEVLPEWMLSMTKPFSQSLPVVNDDLVPAMHYGEVVPVAGLKKVIDESTVELDDGTTLQCDAIIFCTGYTADFSILGKDDPTRETSPEWKKSKWVEGRGLPRVYQNCLSLHYPDSLAFLVGLGFQMPVFQIYDLISMAIAQIWKGNSKLPSKDEMARQVDEHHRWMIEKAKLGSLYPDMVKAHEWMWWVNDAAGTGVNEKLGYGIEGWKFWWQERQFCNLLMMRVYSPHIYRLFEGKRKAWPGARRAIEKVNREPPYETT